MFKLSGVVWTRRVRLLAAVAAIALAVGVVVASSFASPATPSPEVSVQALYGPGRSAVNGDLARFWTVVPPAPANVSSRAWALAPSQGFTVSGNLPIPLYPGLNEPLNLTFTNPNFGPITISRIAASQITITVDRAHGGCAASNFSVRQGLTTPVKVPGHQFAPISLSALKVPKATWPVITMIDTNTNQDVCQGAHLTLTYSGIGANG